MRAALPAGVLALAGGIGALPLAPSVQCSASCDEKGRCMPLRQIWGVQKGGSSSIFDMLRSYGACGTTARYGGDGFIPETDAKENHYFTDYAGPIFRDEYTGTYPAGDHCPSLCHVDGTGGMVVPLASFRLRAMMTSLEAVRARFVLQIREPVSRHLSFLHMRRRLGHSSMSVDKATFIQLGQWETFIEPRLELKLLPPVLSEVQRCSAGAASGNTSEHCSETARLAASLGASMIAGCTIGAAGSVGPDGMAHPEQAVEGVCNHHNYPPTVSWSLYAPALHWYLTQFSRSQILIFNMHTALMRDPNAYLQELLDFLHIPATAHLAALSHANAATPAQALAAADALSCSVRDRLAQIYAPWNDVLYTMEPLLDRFPPVTDVPCRDDLA